jgi:hypothetical protein
VRPTLPAPHRQISQRHGLARYSAFQFVLP